MKKNLICISIVLLILALEISCSTLKSQESPKIIFSRPVNYNPPPVGHWNVFISGSIPLCDVVMEPLTHYFPANNSYLPGLAENWTQSPDKMTFTLKLRKGVMWHDGTELTSLDVWATWHCIYLLKDRAWYFLKNVTIIDDSTLVFYMSMPNDYVPFYILWHWDVVPYSQYGVLASQVYAKIIDGYDISKDATPFNDLLNNLKNLRPATPIGTGPFKFKSISETEIVLEKFTDYWRGVPDIDEFHIVRVTDANVLWSMIQSGQFSWQWAIPTPAQHNPIIGQPWVQIVPVPRQNGVAMYFNSKVYPINEQKVRQAIAYAINRTEILQVKYPVGGMAQKYNTGFNDLNLVNALTATGQTALNSSFLTQYIDPLVYNYNPAKAEQLLQSLGYTKDTDGVYKTPNGTRLDFELESCNGGWLLGPEMDAISAQLAKIGIKITPRLVDYGVYFDPNGDFYQGRYQIGAAVYDGVDFSYDEFYHKYMAIGHGGMYPGHGFQQMQSVPWLSTPVNVTNITIKMQTFPVGCTLAQYNEWHAELAYITQSQVPVLTLCNPNAIMYMNTQQFSGWPAPDDAYWRGLGTYETHGSSYLFRWLLLKPNFYLAVSATPTSGGTITPSAGTLKYAKGTAVSVSATPASGFTFKNWVLDGTAVSGATITVTMGMNHTLSAVFEAQQGLTISVSPSGGGTTNPAAGTIAYAQGTQVTVTATPASGYNFKEWKLDGVSSSGTSITVTMDTSHTLEADFEPVTNYTMYAIVGAIVVVVVAVVAYMMLRHKPAQTG
jgi:ABC-type transport system substrate-binding protein